MKSIIHRLKTLPMIVMRYSSWKEQYSSIQKTVFYFWKAHFNSLEKNALQPWWIGMRISTKKRVLSVWKEFSIIVNALFIVDKRFLTLKKCFSSMKWCVLHCRNTHFIVEYPCVDDKSHFIVEYAYVDDKSPFHQLERVFNNPNKFSTVD